MLIKFTNEELAFIIRAWPDYVLEENLDLEKLAPTWDQYEIETPSGRSIKFVSKNNSKSIRIFAIE
jgi:hypothetical protein